MSLNESLSITVVENWVPRLGGEQGHCPFNGAAGRVWTTFSKYVDLKSTKKLPPVWWCPSVSPEASCFWPGVRVGSFFSPGGRQTASARTWSVSAQRDCQPAVLCDRKSSGKNYHLSKQSICLFGATGRKVRGNPPNSHFGLRLWQGVTLSAYTGVLYAEHILKRHLSGAPVLGSDTVCRRLTSKKSQRVHRNGRICKNMHERHAVEVMPLNLWTYVHASVFTFGWSWTQAKQFSLLANYFFILFHVD